MVLGAVLAAIYWWAATWALYQPAFLIIGGAGVGVYRRQQRKAIKSTLRALPKWYVAPNTAGAVYGSDGAAVLLAKIPSTGMLSLEFDIDNPQESEISLIIRASLPITIWWSS